MSNASQANGLGPSFPPKNSNVPLSDLFSDKTKEHSPQDLSISSLPVNARYEPNRGLPLYCACPFYDLYHVCPDIPSFFACELRDTF